MEWKIALLGLTGSVVPDAIRLLKGKEGNDYTVPEYLKEKMFYVFLGLQMALAVLALYMFKVADPYQAVIYGYAGPQFISSAVNAFVNKTTAVGSKQPTTPTTKSVDTGISKSYKSMAKKFY